MAYRLQFPFQLQSRIAEKDLPVCFQIDRLNGRLFSRSSYVVLELSGFDSDEDASANIPIVWAALRWVLIEQGINAAFDLGPNDIVWETDPIHAAQHLSESMDIPNSRPVHGIAATDGSPIVFQEDQNILFCSCSMIGEIFTQLPLFLSSFTNAFSRPSSEKLFGNSRFRLATDLYSAYYLEHSPSSRLLTLAMVLEVIADPVDKHQAVLQLIERWRADIGEYKLTVAADPDAIASLEDLEREVLVRKEASKRSRIRNTANRLASFLVFDEQQNLAKNAVATYDARSTLVHRGRLEDSVIHEAVEKGKKTVSLLLKAYYYEVMQNEHDV